MTAGFSQVQAGFKFCHYKKQVALLFGKVRRQQSDVESSILYPKPREELD
jgi:hypothetical protein